MRTIRRVRRKLHRWADRHRPVILLYHRVASIDCDPWGLAVPPDRFAEQIEALTRHRKVVPLDLLVAELDRGRAPKDWVAITFDDGYSDLLYEARPVLERCNCPATLFLTTGTLDTEGFWWDRLSEAVLTPKTLPDALHLNGGEHALDWQSRSDDQAEREALHLNLWRWLRRLDAGQREMQLGRIEGWAGATREHVSGITLSDPYTVSITLKQAKATFLNVLAMHFGSVVPKEEVDKYGADFGHHPVGTGAFKLVEWTPGQHLLLQRNKDYFKPDLPHLDEVEIQVGQDPSVSLLRLKKGEVDLTGDGIPPAQFQSVIADPSLKNQVIAGKQLQTSYLALNTQVPPLDNVRVRRAINMAINKERIVRIINNRAVPASQPLPPRMPGYDPNYKGYPYDPEGAKKLLSEAGHPNGFETTLYSINTDPNPRIAQAIQQDLAQIGIKAELKALASSVVIQAGGTPKEAPMIWSGGM